MSKRTNFHGQEFAYEKGRTVVHYENGFCQGGVVYVTPEAARYAMQSLRDSVRGVYQTVNHQYFVE